MTELLYETHKGVIWGGELISVHRKRHHNSGHTQSPPISRKHKVSCTRFMLEVILINKEKRISSLPYMGIQFISKCKQ